MANLTDEEREQVVQFCLWNLHPTRPQTPGKTLIPVRSGTFHECALMFGVTLRTIQNVWKRACDHYDTHGVFRAAGKKRAIVVGRTFMTAMPWQNTSKLSLWKADSRIAHLRLFLEFLLQRCVICKRNMDYCISIGVQHDHN